jgi:5-methylcytosine-specific restriction endonuclease McrA
VTPGEHSDTYVRHLRSPAWQALRLEVLARAQGHCERCEERLASEIHHLHYRTLGMERPEDLLALCEECHRHADSERKAEAQRDAQRALYNARLAGWARKVYGENWERVDGAEQEFETWIEGRDDA